MVLIAVGKLDAIFCQHEVIEQASLPEQSIKPHEVIDQPCLLLVFKNSTDIYWKVYGYFLTTSGLDAKGEPMAPGQ